MSHTTDKYLDYLETQPQEEVDYYPWPDCPHENTIAAGDFENPIEVCTDCGQLPIRVAPEVGRHYGEPPTEEQKEILELDSYIQNGS